MPTSSSPLALTAVGLAVSSGSAMWTDNAIENTAKERDPTGLARATTPNHGQLVEQFTAQYDVTRTGTATIAGRDAYVLELAPTEDADRYSASGSPSKPSFVSLAQSIECSTTASATRV